MTGPASLLYANPGLIALLDGLKDWMVEHAQSAWGPVWLAALSFAESSFFPLPPDIMLIALCFLPKYLGSLHWAMLFAAVCSVASVAGGAAGYAIGRYGGRPLLERLFANEKILAVERAFTRYDVWAVGAAGFTPIPYKIFTIASGAFRLNFWRFLVASALSRSARFFLVAALCAWLGEPLRESIERHANLVGVAFLVLLVAGFVLVKVLAKRAVGSGAAQDEDGAAAEPGEQSP